jgi:hypothetical protein
MALFILAERSWTGMICSLDWWIRAAEALR